MSRLELERLRDDLRHKIRFARTTLKLAPRKGDKEITSVTISSSIPGSQPVVFDSGSRDRIKANIVKLEGQLAQVLSMLKGKP